MMRFVIEVASYRQPPDGDLPPESIVGNGSRELPRIEVRQHLRPASPALLEQSQDFLEPCSGQRAAGPDFRHHGFQRRVCELGEKPLVRGHEVPSQLAETERAIGRPPILAADRNQPESLERGLSNRQRELCELRTGSRERI
jgi:hypothetical protein